MRGLRFEYYGTWYRGVLGEYHSTIVSRGVRFEYHGTMVSRDLRFEHHSTGVSRGLRGLKGRSIRFQNQAADEKSSQNFGRSQNRKLRIVLSYEDLQKKSSL